MTFLVGVSIDGVEELGVRIMGGGEGVCSSAGINFRGLDVGEDANENTLEAFLLDGERANMPGTCNRLSVPPDGSGIGILISS